MPDIDIKEGYENQKYVIISKEKADKEHPYSIINLEAIDNAMAVLKNSDFKIWIYLAKNQNQYKFYLSRVDVCRATGISARTYTTAIQSLIEKGYLVQKEDNSNIYIFYENGKNYPTKEDKIIEIPEQKKQEISNFKF